MTPCIQALSQSTSGNCAIVVFPHAGGSPRYFAPWCRELPAGIDLYGVTYPGRDLLLDVPAPETLVDLASACVTELEPIIQSSGSVVMFGHSMGAYLAFEATRTLERSGISVTALVVSGAEAPHFGTEQAWHRACDDDLVSHIGALDARGRAALAVPELRRMFLPAIRDDYRLVENYRAGPHPQLSCPIHIIYGDSDPEVTESHSAAWAAYTRAGWHVRRFPGDHFYLAAHIAQVVAHISDILD
ncbi:Thioesterase PikA5 [Mycobacterium simulans]|uniref:Thioesterase TesA n=1 Tax=Mycobacterium simulans TaxID=627089 RepID=A0A7Z7IS32_9MYCO|nr:alpha/beta fold hydrolase [Mycobacterium simulans]SOJ57559.1 Thioesterase PikA5 [Mycobacterium simulans]